MKLISMTSFVLQQANYTDVSNISEKYATIWNYANFLKKPLKLEMFVPCDENGNVLDTSDAFKSCEKGFLYGKAKERVLFKYFKVVEYSDNTIEIVSDTAPNFIIPFKKLSNKDWEQRYNHIEDLLKSIIEIQLTETAIKQIGL